MSPTRLAVEGGRAVRTSSPLPLSRPWIDDREVQAVADAVRRGALIGAGAIGREIEAALGSVLGVPRPLLMNSCSSALEAAVLLSGVGPGDEVILPSFTFVSCANAVVRAGGRPVFVEVDPASCNIDPSAVARAVTPRTRAVMVVHYAGRPCDMDPLLDVARSHHLRLIEDAAHALGGTWQDRPLGTLGDFGCFSFHGSKDVVCGEGGALVCRDAADVEAAEILREKGTNRSAFMRGEVSKYEWVALGGSLILSDVLAAMLGPQLRRLPEILDRKRELARGLRTALGDLGELVGLPPASEESSWHLFPILVPAAVRGRVIEALRAEGIGAAFHFVPLHDSPYGREQLGYRHGDLPVTEQVGARLVRLPLFPTMTDADLNDVAAATSKVVRHLVAPGTLAADGR